MRDVLATDKYGVIADRAGRKILLVQCLPQQCTFSVDVRPLPGSRTTARLSLRFLVATQVKQLARDVEQRGVVGELRIIYSIVRVRNLLV